LRHLEMGVGVSSSRSQQWLALAYYSRSWSTKCRSIDHYWARQTTRVVKYVRNTSASLHVLHSCNHSAAYGLQELLTANIMG